jgi:hypothetical protein
MNTEHTDLLHTLVAAQILLLARALRWEDRRKGIHSTVDYEHKAVSLLRQRRDELLRLLAETH